ncbi:MAG: hypothetical protein JRI23_32745, partial [Deltaproteobacteria bacterium]|nr:hypothetical protein [Deltaproteobacteria bacterium]MBW2537021.1 hypothetical protein [Deltaproteobacteria bacterium]
MSRRLGLEPRRRWARPQRHAASDRAMGWRRSAGAGGRVVPLGLAAGVALSAAIGIGAASSARDPYMKVSELRPGMKGYGLTVFSGTKPERFDVEILATLTNFRPQQDLIIVKTDHPRLRIAHTVAGMSGSPVYVDGRMIGAYAYGWYFGSEPVAGVTPIHNMLADLRRPIPPELAPHARQAPLPPRGRKRALHRGGGAHRFVGAPLDYDLEQHAGQVARRTAPALAA